MGADRQATKKPDESEYGENVGAESMMAVRRVSQPSPPTVLSFKIVRFGRAVEQIADSILRVLLTCSWNFLGKALESSPTEKEAAYCLQDMDQRRSMSW